MEEGAGTGGVKVGESTRGQGKKKVKKRDTTGWSRRRQVSERLSMHWSVTEGSSKSERINDLKMEVRPAAAEGSFVEDMQTVSVTEDPEVGGGVGRRAGVAPPKGAAEERRRD